MVDDSSALPHVVDDSLALPHVLTTMVTAPRLHADAPSTTLEEDPADMVLEPPEHDKGAEENEPLALFKLEIQRLAGLDDDLQTLGAAVVDYYLGQNSASSPFRFLELVTSRIGTDTFDEVRSLFTCDEHTPARGKLHSGVDQGMVETMIKVLDRRGMLDDRVIHAVRDTLPPKSDFAENAIAKASMDQDVKYKTQKRRKAKGKPR
jgi:hypothetical protein